MTELCRKANVDCRTLVTLKLQKWLRQWRERDDQSPANVFPNWPRSNIKRLPVLIPSGPHLATLTVRLCAVSLYRAWVLLFGRRGIPHIPAGFEQLCAFILALPSNCGCLSERTPPPSPPGAKKDQEFVQKTLKDPRHNAREPGFLLEEWKDRLRHGDKVMLAGHLESSEWTERCCGPLASPPDPTSPSSRLWLKAKQAVVLHKGRPGSAQSVLQRHTLVSPVSLWAL